MRTSEKAVYYYLFERNKSLEYVRQIATSREDKKLGQMVEHLQGMSLEDIQVLVEPTDQSLEVEEVECELVERDVA